ncbi:hypothetical protein K1719_001769 [Acacia pycnantha]|nr:hypothetical protein K1719_001769 [Acacia pycnantha]
MEEEAKLVPKNGSDCENNRASSAAANGKYDLCGRTPTSQLTMDEISPASLIKHDDRSEWTPMGLRNFFLERVLFPFPLPPKLGPQLGRCDKTDRRYHPHRRRFVHDEAVNTEFVDQVHDSAADSISDTTDFSLWERGHCIGTGGFGNVYVDRNRKTGDLRAVKELKNIENAESIRKEIKILCQLKHPNTVKYYGHEEDGHKISVYMEFIQPGSLKKYILKRGALHETLIQKFTAQILSGLVYLHNERLVDFGVSKHLVESVGNHSMWGTPFYVAPEVLQKTEYKSSHEASAADICSLGCVIIEMLSGKHPWPDCEPVQAFWKVSTKKQRPPIPDVLCKEGKHFLELCFGRTPADRPSAAELLDHPFVKPQTYLADGKEYKAELDGVVEIIGVLA